MAGSLVERNYVDDRGNIYGVFVDESNANARVGETNLCDLLTNAASDSLPRRFQRRYVLAFNKAVPVQRRKFWVGSVAAAINILNGNNIFAQAAENPGGAAPPQVEWIATFYSGERKKLIPRTSTGTAVDTGLNDGTAN